MKRCRIHVTGASGSGTTTLGRALANEFALPHHDTDDYFWQPTAPPYQHKREIADRLRLMHDMFVPRAGWVLSGSIEGWGNSTVAFLDLVVFLVTTTPIRIQRLRAREATHFGADAVAPGGWRHEECEAFIEWAAHYDAGDREGRSLARHQAWFAALPCPVLRLDGSRPQHELIAEVRGAIPI